ncbi:nucleotidyltransferase family protein [Haloferax volcanii]|uniref:UDP-N-acetylglucosamine pyrophosphorylase n=3 Tax=Haloferax volcanii TaxID=2246 RepID=A0A384LB66_HALVD|nr:nucleotidyltransferase family protein [Haloferax volcanii]ADE01312.1 molybdenum cofactor nucleotidyltransferase domain protein [Haloferax volcanii DS2]ELY36900.1 UDP-N-acetylglucosamine pyrophosphorylase [Haloferax volcanii DS2]MBS8118017.1 nucleotidyltransferase family protein [Haloferax volcanii]MBS8123029.1 nucleotidyltransferase family protein [Haloferax volcanii]MBS8126897.1 nucleotidyltransferase family protein [Haloferax volcanii]
MTRVGILLAAGAGTRFEPGNKLCQPLDGEPIVRRAARRLIESPVDETVVVLGHDAERVRRALEPLETRLTVVRNERYDAGQSASVRRGAEEVLSRGGSVGVFALGDMPAVGSATYDELLAAIDRDDRHVVVPVYDGQRGNPVAFDAAALDRFGRLTGDAGARALFEAMPVARVAVDDPGIHADIDTVADLEAHR